jgi:hypothetical protein
METYFYKVTNSAWVVKTQNAQLQTLPSKYCCFPVSKMTTEKWAFFTQLSGAAFGQRVDTPNVLNGWWFERRNAKIVAIITELPNYVLYLR